MLAVERNGLRCVSLNVCADDTFNDCPSAELLRRHFPDVADVRRPYEAFEAFYSNEKAEALLGWRPLRRWRKKVARLID